jgi:peptidoglycan DL-endopeptidase CwlO
MIKSAVAAGAFAVAVLATGCASARGSVPQPFPMRGSAPGVSRVAAIDTDALIATALQLRGVRYRNGGANPLGFDCSGFTQYVFAQHRLALPREVRDQFKAGQSVAIRDLAPGDLMFFTTTAPGATHVAIAVGSDAFVHAPSSTGVVRVERLSSGYWSRRYLGARRLTPP